MADTTALVPVFTGTIADRTAQLCDARTLHNFMQVRRDFTTWIKGRIRKFGFTLGEDYLLTKSGEQLPSGMKYVHDYHLTLDMAKELSMVENNEQGRAARRYFIECERQALAAAQSQPVRRLDYDRISPAQNHNLEELVYAVLKKRGFDLALSAGPASGLLPEAQAKEITERLNRLGKLFHPFSDQFNDVMGVLRVLRGMHPAAGMPEPGYRQLLPRLA